MNAKKYAGNYDKTPKYTVKDVSEILEMSAYTIRYYDNSGLIPGLARTDGNIRMFSEYAVSWLRLVHCLRATGLSIEGIKRYISLCLEGDSTIGERAEIIFRQENVLRQQLKELQKQMEVLKYKKGYYKQLLQEHHIDRCNPAAGSEKYEPHLLPAEQIV